MKSYIAYFFLNSGRQNFTEIPNGLNVWEALPSFHLPSVSILFLKPYGLRTSKWKIKELLKELCAWSVNDLMLPLDKKVSRNPPLFEIIVQGAYGIKKMIFWIDWLIFILSWGYWDEYDPLCLEYFSYHPNLRK